MCMCTCMCTCVCSCSDAHVHGPGAGLRTAEILEAMDSFSKTELPAAVRQKIHDETSRYGKVKLDPSKLQKPEGYEATYKKEDPGPSKAELEMEKRKKALEKAEADLKAMEEQRELQEIEARRRAQGIKPIKKQRY